MDFNQYRILALGWARDHALNDPTYEFCPTSLARTIEEPNPKGEFVQNSDCLKQLYSLLGRLEKQGVLVKTRSGTEKIGSISYSQDYYSFTDTNHKILLNLLGVKATATTPNEEKDLVSSDIPPRNTGEFFDTAFSVYSKVKQIGNGGSGTVFLVKDEDGSPFALKMLTSSTSKKTKRFKNELQFCLSCDHKGIVKVLDYGYKTQNGHKSIFYIMPYYEKTLRNLINDGITGESILKYSLLILDALEFAHEQRVWHRDIKPENILYDPTADSLVLADFGIAHFEQELLYTYVETKDERVANFQYAAWEQKTAGNVVDGRADLYAFGLILNEMFTRKVVHGTSFVKIGDSQPEFGFLDNFVDILIKQLPKDRPTSANAVRTELLARINLAKSEKTISILMQPRSDETRMIRDNIYNDPIRIETVNFINPNLVFKVNQQINEEWTQLFNEVSNAARVKEMGYPWYIPEKDTILFQITGNQNYQKITDDLKLHINNTNLRYKNMIDDQFKEWQISEQKKVEDRILRERQKQDILKSIRL